MNPSRRTLSFPVALAATIVATIATITAGRPAGADPGAGSRKVQIHGTTGEYEVETNPAFLTSIILPEPVESAVCSNPAAFRCVTPKELENVVAIRPRSADPKQTGNVVISTKTLRITVTLRITPNAREAETQLTLVKAEEEAELRARIRSAVEHALAAERASIDRRVEERMALQMFQRLEDTRLSAIERNAERIVVRVTRAVRTGDDVALLWVEIENLSSSTYNIARIEASGAGRIVSGAIIWAGHVARAPQIGQVARSGKGLGVVVVHGLASLRGRLTVTVAEAGGARRVTVEGIGLP